MESRARHTLIGAFTLAVIAAGFAFVYWINAGGGIAQRAVYRIRYDGPVAGLLKGSAVLFNGVRVGEVTALALDPAAPASVEVEIAVERQTPVRADTRVGIDFQGLAGAPVVALSGGTASLPLLAAAAGKPPLLKAEKDAGTGMAQAAREVLRHIDTVVTDNAEPLKNLIANIDKFAAALSRNTDRVDGIMSGLERLTGGGAKAQPRIFDLAAARSFPDIKKRPAGQLLVLEPTALAQLDTERILVRRATPPEGGQQDTAQWPDMLPKVVQARIVQSFENAQYMRVLARIPEETKTDNQLAIDIRKFQVAIGETASAQIEIAARLIKSDGRVVDARVFSQSAPVASTDPAGIAQALSDLFEKTAADIVTWTCAAI